MPTMASFHLCDDGEIPTVFVKKDKKIGYSISSTIDSVIPFVAVTTEDYTISTITGGSYH